MLIDENKDEVVEKRIELKKDNFDDWLKQKKTLWRKSRRKKRQLHVSGDKDSRTRIGKKKQ